MTLLSIFKVPQRGHYGTCSDDAVCISPQVALTMVKVSIVGSAGRRADIQRLNKTLYYHMIDKAKEVLTDVWKLQIEQVELVSGGAAWSGEQST